MRSPSTEIKSIIIKGAREHNLKNIDLEIPKKKLIVFITITEINFIFTFATHVFIYKNILLKKIKPSCFYSNHLSSNISD